MSKQSGEQPRILALASDTGNCVVRRPVRGVLADVRHPGRHGRDHDRADAEQRQRRDPGWQDHCGGRERAGAGERNRDRCRPASSCTRA